MFPVNREHELISVLACQSGLICVLHPLFAYHFNYDYYFSYHFFLLNLDDGYSFPP